ncbi:hypothetical protein ACQP2E_10335 [Actinoplanes sp. CA-015351]|uniref:hypothetical protein n=1 Tax=Actinoplanes sp. CA-015351 TaxID=3239897 RepID=UPI003D95F6E7
MIVLDTNVVSELMRAQPARSVIEWMQRISAAGPLDTASLWSTPGPDQLVECVSLRAYP